MRTAAVNEENHETRASRRDIKLAMRFLVKALNESLSSKFQNEKKMKTDSLFILCYLYSKIILSSTGLTESTVANLSFFRSSKSVF